MFVNCSSYTWLCNNFYVHPAPEIFQKEPVCTNTDMWPVGVMLYKM